MTGNDIFSAIGNIDRKFILESAPDRRRKGIISPAARRSLIAACLCIILCSSVIVGTLMSGYVPTVNRAMFSAEEIERILHRDVAGVSTNAYQTVRVRSPEELEIHTLPNAEYLSIYETQLSKLDEEELVEFTESILPKLEELFGYELEYGEVRRDSRWRDGSHSYIYVKCKSTSEETNVSPMQIEIRQRKDYYYIELQYQARAIKAPALQYNGKDVIVSPSMNEDELYESLSGLNNALCGILGIELPYHKYYHNSIFFHNGVTHPTENYATQRAEDIYEFDNFLRVYGGISHKYQIVAQMKIYRKDIEDYCPEIARAKMITLEEAEDLLCKGYVFGGHTCAACMAEQNGVDFEEYDYVGLEYVFGQDHHNYDTVGVPFYVFYKLIETEELETHTVYTYAKTYVPAVKVSGLDEYFEMQKEKHREDGEYY